MEISLQEFFDLQPYELDKEQKEKMLSAHLGKLTEYHREYCGLYKIHISVRPSLLISFTTASTS